VFCVWAPDLCNCDPPTFQLFPFGTYLNKALLGRTDGHLGFLRLVYVRQDVRIALVRMALLDLQKSGSALLASSRNPSISLIYVHTVHVITICDDDCLKNITSILRVRLIFSRAFVVATRTPPKK
jgi:hypothetical protein